MLNVTRSSETKHTQKIVSKVTQFDFRSINDGDASNATKNKVLQGFRASRAAIQ